MRSRDTILHGATDMHRHGYPEIGPEQRTSLEDVDDLTLCSEAGMRGVVMKSHVWPTIGRSYHLGERVPGLEVIPSITLNSLSGGLDPFAVHVAAEQGARVVFMPTWSSSHDRGKQAMSARIAKVLGVPTTQLGDPVTMADGNGRLKPEVREVLRVAEDNRMVVSTGHISVSESLALADADIVESDRLIFAHPDSHSVGASKAEFLEMAGRGCVIEMCALGTLPPFQRIGVGEMADLILEVGVTKCVLTSDYFFEWSPPSSEMLRMVALQLAETDVGYDGVRRMLVDVPNRLLEGRVSS